MHTFPYKPIELSRDAIHLVLVCMDNPGQDVRCEIVQTFLSEEDDPMPYEALSYTWGGDPGAENAPTIFINDREVSVTHNLLNALKSLRPPDEDRMIWVDALCINQNDREEKGHRVGQMRQVYEHASSVLIWLGSGDDEFETSDNIELLMV